MCLFNNKQCFSNEQIVHATPVDVRIGRGHRFLRGFDWRKPHSGSRVICISYTRGATSWTCRSWAVFIGPQRNAASWPPFPNVGNAPVEVSCFSFLLEFLEGILPSPLSSTGWTANTDDFDGASGCCTKLCCNSLAQKGVLGCHLSVNHPWPKAYSVYFQTLRKSTTGSPQPLLTRTSWRHA